MSPVECSILSCEKPHEAKGYCSAHYWRFRKHGDPLGGRAPYGEVSRFIREVALRHTGDKCLTWPFGKTQRGYGLIWIDGKHVIASRYVCELVHGSPPTPEHDAAHSCGKGHEGCVAPEHLSWKTPVENKADELLHGTRPRGERNGHAKLTEAEAREILALKGVELQRNLAARFGVSRTAVASIHSGRKWTWLS